MPTPQSREPGRRPRNPDTERYTMQGDWAVPNQYPCLLYTSDAADE